MQHFAYVFAFSYFILLPYFFSSGEANDAFVRVGGDRFFINGVPFYVNGFNAYWLMTVASDPNQRYKVSEAFRAATAHGLTVGRTWAYSDGGPIPLQYSPGFYNERVFQGLDFVIAEAKRHRIRLILTLGNNYHNFGGKQQYVNWARSKGQYLASEDDFFRHPLVRTYFKNHIKTILNRYNKFTGLYYKNDPTIMAWELMNEPRCGSDRSGRTIQSWLMEMSSYVKSLDRNHLLEAGLEGFYGYSTPIRRRVNPAIESGTDFIANNRIPYIDFATVHAYPDQWLANPSGPNQIAFMNSWLSTHIADAQLILKKPVLITEFGVSRNQQGFYQRDQIFNTVYYKIYASAKAGGAAGGGLFWQLVTGGMENLRDGYEIMLGDQSSVSVVIGLQSRRLRLLRRKQMASQRSRH